MGGGGMSKAGLMTMGRMNSKMGDVSQRGMGLGGIAQMQAQMQKMQSMIMHLKAEESEQKELINKITPDKPCPFCKRPPRGQEANNEEEEGAGEEEKVQKDENIEEIPKEEKD